MIKYQKAERYFDHESVPDSKITLRDNEPPSENIWVRRSPDNTLVFLRNDAFSLHPFYSYGSIHLIEKGEVNVSSLKDQNPSVILLHPDMWNQYIKEGICDEEGNIKITMNGKIE